MKNVLVTGGAGYIGSHTCKLLAQQGHRPVILDSLERGKKELALEHKLYVGLIQDEELLSDILRTEKIEAIMHFAAYCYVEESVQAPLPYYENNTVGTLKLLEVALREGVKKFVFSSTCATYGIPERVPIAEDCPQNPINPYGRSKLIVENILQDLARANMMDVVALRYFNAAGADLEGDLGECHDPETHLIPVTIQRILRKESVQIYGKDYSTSDGTCVRDYIHVTDLADGHVRALQFLTNHRGFHAFNLGTGTGISNLKIVEELLGVLGSSQKVEFLNRRTGDPAELVAAPQKAKQVLGFEAQLSDLKTIAKTAVAWEQKKQGL